jgi:hypothetical protein
MYKLTFGLLGIFTLLTACNSKQTNETTTPVANKETATATTTVTKSAITAAATWIDDFKTLRDAIYNKQKEVVASYFNFPITQNNEALWSICSNEVSPANRPFTKDDFIKNFDKIFSAEFVATLLKVKSEELYKVGTTTTPVIKGKDVSSSMTTTFDKEKSSLRIALDQEFYVEDGTGGESSTIMGFAIKDNKLKFNRLEIAG